jgi:ABC-type glutathione transport system ATPase component
VSSGTLSRPLLLAHGVTKTYTQQRWSQNRCHKALDEVDLVLHSGKTLALVGESGSGKTTLAMCLAALERPDAGEIWLEGWDLVSAGKQQLAAVRAQLQLLWQDSAGALSPFLTAGGIVEEPFWSSSAHRVANDAK